MLEYKNKKGVIKKAAWWRPVFQLTFSWYLSCCFS